MSALSSEKVQTRIFDPVYHTNVRTEFKLTNDNYLSTLRLYNLGCTTNPASQYGSFGGVHNLIQHIYLYDDNKLLDQLRNAHLYLSFHSIKRDNSTSADVEHYTSKNLMGFDLTATKRIKKAKAVVTTTNNILTTPVGYLDLKRCFGLLQSNPILPKMFKSLRVVIEYNTSITDLFNQGHASAVTNITRPLLIADAIDIQKVQLRPYLSLVHDRVNLEQLAVADADDFPVQSKQFAIKGFDNHFVRRLLLINESRTRNLTQNGTSYSNAPHLETIQIDINGQTFFAGNGAINDPNRKLQLLAESWGDINCCFGQQYYLLAGRGANGSRVQVLDAGPNAMNGTASYGGFTLNRRVNELQMVYNRTGTFIHGLTDATNPSSTAQNIHVFGEVERAIVPMGDIYSVEYL